MKDNSCCPWCLWEFSFNKFVTPHVLGHLYALSWLAAVVWGLFYFFGTLFGDTTWWCKLWAFIGAPLGVFLWVLITRFVLEQVKVAFAILERLDRIADQGGMGGKTSGCCGSADSVGMPPIA